MSGGTATLWDLLGAVIFLFSKRLGIVMQCGLRYFAGNVHGPIFFSVGLCKSETPERTFALFRKRCQGEEVTVFFPISSCVFDRDGGMREKSSRAYLNSHMLRIQPRKSAAPIQTPAPSRGVFLGKAWLLRRWRWT